MQETSWMKIAGIALLVAVLVGLGVADWRLLEAIERQKGELRELRSAVVETDRLAREEASAASAANQRATEAAMRAEIAAGARKQAEQQSQAAVSSAQQAKEEAARANEDMQRMRREREEELNRMQEALSRVAETKRTPQGMLVILPDSTFRFEFDKADLNQKNRELLSRVAGILLASKGYGISVFGYTDDVGSADYNQQLSVRRAAAVADYLVQAGVDPGIINRKGYGKSSPVIDGSAPTARAKNRRVEIAVTDSSIRYGGEAAPPQ